jgi:hypothetical protein
MTDATDGQPTAEQAAIAAEEATLAAEAEARGGAVPLPPPGASSLSTPDDRPELVVGAAFAGGLVLALLLKRLAR